MIKLRMKNYNMVLTDKQQKYQRYRQVKLINMNILPVKRYYHLIKVNIIEQPKFPYSPLGKTFEKQAKTSEEQGKRQIDAISNQNKRLEAITNQDDRKSIYKEIFDKLVKKNMTK